MMSGGGVMLEDSAAILGPGLLPVHFRALALFISGRLPFSFPNDPRPVATPLLAGTSYL
jgi:hypothetical protein